MDTTPLTLEHGSSSPPTESLCVPDSDTTLAKGGSNGRGRESLEESDDCDRGTIETCSLNTVDEADLRTFLSKIRANRVSDVRDMLDARVVPPLTRDRHGNSGYLLAVQNGYKAMAKLFLRRGCSINDKNTKGQTALHFCYAFGHMELAEYLLSKGADPRLKNEYGLTCFQGLAPGKERQRMQNRPSVTMPDSSRLQQPSSRYCASDISSVSSASSMESPRMIGTHEKNGLSSFRVSSGPYLNQSFLSSSTNDDLCSSFSDPTVMTLNSFVDSEVSYLSSPTPRVQNSGIPSKSIGWDDMGAGIGSWESPRQDHGSHAFSHTPTPNYSSSSSTYSNVSYRSRSSDSSYTPMNPYITHQTSFPSMKAAIPSQLPETRVFVRPSTAEVSRSSLRQAGMDHHPNRPQDFSVRIDPSPMSSSSSIHKSQQRPKSSYGIPIQSSMMSSSFEDPSTMQRFGSDSHAQHFLYESSGSLSVNEGQGLRISGQQNGPSAAARSAAAAALAARVDPLNSSSSKQSSMPRSDSKSSSWNDMLRLSGLHISPGSTSNVESVKDNRVSLSSQHLQHVSSHLPSNAMPESRLNPVSLSQVQESSSIGSLVNASSRQYEDFSSYLPQTPSSKNSFQTQIHFPAPLSKTEEVDCESHSSFGAYSEDLNDRLVFRLPNALVDTPESLNVELKVGEELVVDRVQRKFPQFSDPLQDATPIHTLLASNP